MNIAAGTLQLSTAAGTGTNVANQQFPAAADLAIGAAGTLQLNGYNLSVKSLNGYGIVTNSASVATLNVGSGNSGSMTFAGDIQGAVALTYSGTGTLTLVGFASNFTGGTTINSGGTIAIQSARSLGNAASDTVLVNNGGELDLQGGSGGLINGLPNALTIAGAGVSGGALNNTSDVNTVSGTVTLSAPATIKSSAGFLLFNTNTASTYITNNGNLLTFTGTAPITVTGNASGGAGYVIGGNNPGTNNTGGLAYTGTSVLTLTTANNYSGGTTIGSGAGTGTVNINTDSALGTAPGTPAVNITFTGAGGILQFANSMTLSSNRGIFITPGATATLDTLGNSVSYGGVISDPPGGILQVISSVAGGSLALTGSNSYTGGTVIGSATSVGGTLSINADAALGATSANPNITFANNGTLQFSGTFSLSSARNIAIGSGVTGTIDVESNGVTYGGVISGSGSGSALTVTSSTGGGLLTLNGSSPATYTGATTINGAALRLDLGNLPAGTGMINSASTLVLAAGSLTVVDRAGVFLSSQSFNGTVINPGFSTIVVNANGTALPTSALALGAISRNAGGTVDFTLPFFGNITTTTAASIGTDSTNFILGGWATTNGATDWATTGGVSSPFNVIALTTYTPDTGPGNNYGWSAGNNVSVGVSGNDLPTAGSTANSLRFNNTASNTVTLSGANTLTSGGILVVPSVGANISSIVGTGTLTSGNAQHDLIISQFDVSGPLTIGVAIVNTPTSPLSLTKLAPGTLILSGNNGFTGGATVGSGALVLQSAAALGGNTGGAVSVLTGAELDIQGNITVSALAGSNAISIVGVGTSGGGALNTAGTSGTPGYNGNVTLTGAATIGAVAGTTLNLTSTSGVTNGGFGLTFTGAGNITEAGGISGAGGLTKSGAGTLTLSAGTGHFTYGGATTINGGTLILDFSGGGSGIVGSGSGVPPLVLGGGTLTFNVSGQNFPSTTINPGASVVNKTNIATVNPIYTLGPVTRNPGGTVDFTLTANLNSQIQGPINGAPVNVTNILAGWATCNGGTNWAAGEAPGGSPTVIIPFGATGLQGPTGSFTNDTWGTTTDTAVTSFSNSNPIASGSTTNSLAFNDTNSADAVTLSGGVNAIASGGILVTPSVGAFASAITGSGTITSGNGQDLIVNQWNTTGSFTPIRADHRQRGDFHRPDQVGPRPADPNHGQQL